MEHKSIYLASPFFSKTQMKKVLEIEKALKANPSVGTIYSPRKDQAGSGYNPKTQTKQWARWIYRQDMTEVKYADICLFVLDFDGQDPDSGTTWEAGYAKAINKPVITVSLDHIPENLMLVIGSDYELRSISQIRHHNFNKAASWEYKDPIYGLLASGSKDGSNVQKDVQKNNESKQD